GHPAEHDPVSGYQPGPGDDLLGLRPRWPDRAWPRASRIDRPRRAGEPLAELGGPQPRQLVDLRRAGGRADGALLRFGDGQYGHGRVLQPAPARDIVSRERGQEPVAHILGTRPQSGQDLKAYAGKPLLQVNDLQIHFHTSRGVARVVDGTTLTLNHGEILGIAGESGSGKTTLVEAILQIVRFPNREARGEVLFSPGDHDPVDLMTLSQEQMRPWRGRHIAYVPQGSQNSLNPIDWIGRQIVLGMTE